MNTEKSSNPLSRLLADSKDAPQSVEPVETDQTAAGPAIPAVHKEKVLTTAVTSARPAKVVATRRGAPSFPRTGDGSDRAVERATHARDDVPLASDRHQDRVKVDAEERRVEEERDVRESAPTGYGKTSNAPKNETEAREELLEELTPAIESAKVFAERWEERYRPHVFQVALERLVRSTTAVGRPAIQVEGGPAAFGAAGRPRTVGDAVAADRHSSGPVTGAGVGVYEKLAKALGVDIDSVERFLKVDDNGKLHILARIDGKTKKELQTKYSLAYLYVKEVAFGERMVDVDELRSLCIDNGCYDLANFSGYLGKDEDPAGLLRRHGGKGARDRKYLLSKKGLDAAEAILRGVVAQ